MDAVVSADSLIYAMSKDHTPILRVQDGATVVFETCDCFENQIQSESQEFGTLDWNRINPATGPVYVEGAEPGDVLVVHIVSMELEDSGVMTTGPGLGVLGDQLQDNVIRKVPIADGVATLPDGTRWPVQPMIGVIGTAPTDAAVSCGTPGEHGGNMDCKRITTGARLLLPVNVPGALFALGDLHAAMGDGEVAVCGVEIAGRVTVQLHVLRQPGWPVPMLVNDTHVMTIASAKLLDDAATMATQHMVQWLLQECHLDTATAAFLLSAAGDLRICQVVDPLKTARMELPRNIAESHGFTFAW